MSKSKIVLAAVGGVSAVAMLAMCAVLWLAFSAKTAALEGDADEGTDGLETVVDQARGLSTGKPYPGPESVKDIKSDIERLSDWRTGAMRFASRGDRVFEKTTPPAFKSFIVRDAKRLSRLGGAVNGAIVKPDFAFGPFKPYILEGKMPEEARLQELQRRWDDVSSFVEMLATNGVSELVSVDFRDAAADAEAEKEKKAAQQRRNRGGAKKAETKPAFKPLSHSYVAVFRARPTALVNVVNAIASGERFVVVDALSFEHAKDALLVALGGEDKGKANAQQQQTGRRRRRRGGDDGQPNPSNNPSAETAAMKDGIVTDPALDDPFDVTLAFTVYDFNSLAEEPSASDKEGKGSSK